jgi:FAD/FMN-containing dehydrogenase
MALAPASIDQLRKDHRGHVITPEDPAYEQGRRVWNAMIDKRPAVIVRPRTAVDVVAAVKFGRDQRLPIAIRGGAHGIAGTGTCDDGIVIDFSEMRGIRIDPMAKVVRAEPGVKWEELDRETQAHGLAVTGGTVGDTGIAGLTLGGGFGWLGGVLGMTVDNLVSADIVLASGDQVRASATEHPDLFWAIRGGGGNFGVVTSFEYRLHAIGPLIVGGMVVHPFPAAAEVLRFYGTIVANAPDQLTAAGVLLHTPDGQKACGIVVAYAGPVDEGEKAVAPIKAFGSPAMDVIGPMPYVAQQELLANAMPPNLFNYWKAEFVPRVSDGFLDTAVDAFAKAPSPMSTFLLFPIHGAATRVPVGATAYPHRSGIHTGIYSLWTDRAQDAVNIQWVRDTWQAIQPFARGGVYVNELGDDEGGERVQQAYGTNHQRLSEIKAKYDPDNLFHLNANIKPAVAGVG